MSEISGAPHAAPEARRRTDLSLELLRQHTLLQLMTARMNETAEALDLALPYPMQHLERAMAVHRDYLIEVHHRLESLLRGHLTSVAAPEVRSLLAECASSHPMADLFQKELRVVVEKEPGLGSATRARMAALIRAEAQRIETHHAREESVYVNLHQYLPGAAEAEIVKAACGFDPARIAAEIELMAWASSVHPSSD
jgi:hypothetical protein